MIAGGAGAVKGVNKKYVIQTRTIHFFVRHKTSPDAQRNKQTRFYHQISTSTFLKAVMQQQLVSSNSAYYLLNLRFQSGNIIGPQTLEIALLTVSWQANVNEFCDLTLWFKPTTYVVI